MDKDVLQAIGNTSLVRLRRLVPDGAADIHAKLEWEDPTGSVKDRMARRANVVAALQLAERLGRGARVVTLLADSGLEYLSTDVYKR